MQALMEFERSLRKAQNETARRNECADLLFFLQCRQVAAPASGVGAASGILARVSGPLGGAGGVAPYGARIIPLVEKGMRPS
jgi:hypothetical protein